MSEKSIAELIHDRAFAEGATLVVWTDAARFRRMLVAEGMERIRPRLLHVPDRLGEYDGVSDLVVPAALGPVTTVKFDASVELLNLIRRNVDAVREYNDRMIRDWCAELKKKSFRASPCVGPSGSSAVETPIGKGPEACDCHAKRRRIISAFSLVGIVSITSAIAVLGSACEIADGFHGRKAGTVDLMAVVGKPYDFNAKLTGRGGGCSLGAGDAFKKERSE